MDGMTFDVSQSWHWWLTIWDPYQLAIFALAVWLVVSLLPQVIVLAKRAEGIADWEVVTFRASLLALGICVAARYFFDLTPWVIVAGWLALDISSTLNTIYIISRARDAEQDRNYLTRSTRTRE
jgi:hypothetical protein